jgi:Protein of unknown function (DUF1656)
MMHSFPELTIGGVLIAPFVIYAGAAIAIFAVLRPFLHLVGFDRAFSSPPIAELSLYDPRATDRAVLEGTFPCNHQAPARANK